MSTINTVNDLHGDAVKIETFDAGGDAPETVITITDSMSGYREDGKTVARALFTEVGLGLFIETLAETAGLDKRPTPPTPDAVLASEVSFNEAVLRVAAAHGRVANFRYAKGDGSHIESRSVNVGSIKKVGDHVTFTGYDPDRDAVRAYRSDRIKGEVQIGNRFAA